MNTIDINTESKYVQNIPLAENVEDSKQITYAICSNIYIHIDSLCIII